MDNDDLILSTDEIKLIEEEAKHPIYRNSSAIFIGGGFASVERVSEKGLILIRGNKHTGLEHINHRHSRYTSGSFWKQEKDEHGNEKIKLDNPSKFSGYTIPIVTYVEIADQIFSEENKKVEENKNTDLFDVYSGEYIHRDGTKMRYRLVTYKDTKIIHTLYPLKKTFTREKILNLHRSRPSGEHNLGKGLIKIEIPYLDYTNEIVCKLIFLIDEVALSEEVWVEYPSVPLDSKHHIIAHRKLAKMIEVPKYMSHLEFKDIKEFEKIVKKIMQM